MSIRVKLAVPGMALIAMAAVPGPAEAVVTRVFDSGLVHTTGGLLDENVDADFVATGTSMGGFGGGNGITVTVFFADDPLNPNGASWAALDPNSDPFFIATDPGGAFGAGWQLTAIENTYPAAPGFGRAAWRFLNNTARAVRRIVIDAGVGNHVFDTRGENGEFTFAPLVTGTPGSGDGWSFDIGNPANPPLPASGGVGFFTPSIFPTDLFGHFDAFASSDSVDITATYKDSIALTGETPVGDLYRELTIEFADGGLADGQVLKFYADTDKLEFPLVPVPAPGAAVLATIGIGAVYRRRRPCDHA